jgi:hypothetical protein
MNPSKDFSTRYLNAKQWREGIRPLIQGAFRFCAPGREYDFVDIPKAVRESDVFSSIGEEVATDLAGDLVSYFTPPEAMWASYAVITEVDPDQADVVLNLVRARERDLFDMIAQSNYNDVAPQWGFEAAVHGTPALWVTRGAIGQPIHCEVVPPHELLITPGHRYLDRFRETTVEAFAVKPLLQDYNVTYPRELEEKFAKPGAKCDVVWGFWVDWSDPNRPLWRCEITVDAKRVTPEDPLTLGDIAGSCPLLVGRFNPQPGQPWGRGCGIKALPDFRTNDSIEDAILAGLDQSLLNTLIYPSDGALDLSEGIDPGRAYPAGPKFDRNSIFELNRGVNLDYGYFSQESYERRIRTAFYQDGPTQRGDTPPTATQWADERRRVQQRIGKPSAPLWTEMIRPLIQRFEYLGVLTGQIEEAISHAEGQILVTPISPLQKAQNYDKIRVFRSNLETIAAAAGPEALVQIVDLGESLKSMVTTSGDEIMKIRSEPVEQPAQPPQG